MPDLWRQIPRYAPMLCGSSDYPFDDPDWIFEVKWDGYRALVYFASGEIEIFSRNGLSLLREFEHLKSLVGAIKADSCVLDGEIVAVRDGRADFSFLRSHKKSAVFVAFDLLYLDCEPLIDVDLEKRKAMLADVVVPSVLCQVPPFSDGAGKDLFQWVCQRNLEGIVAKRKGSKYTPGDRSSDWLKIKNFRESAFYVVEVNRDRKGNVVSLTLSDGDRVVGRVSQGLGALVSDAKLGKSPSASAPSVSLRADDLSGLKVLVRYTEITPSGRIRHPVLRGILS